jgi:cell division protein ZapA (FtsZ GTPase activity inhibitor)
MSALSQPRLIDLTIGGRVYRLTSTPEEESKLRALATRVDAMMEEMRGAMPDMDRDRQMMMVCLQLCSTLAEADKRLDEQATSVTLFHRSISERLEKMLGQI